MVAVILTFPHSAIFGIILGKGRIVKLKGMRQKFRSGGKRKKKLNMTIFFRFVLITSSKKTLFDIVRVRRLY